jgi:hypothetical protein
MCTYPLNTPPLSDGCDCPETTETDESGHCVTCRLATGEAMSTTTKTNERGYALVRCADPRRHLRSWQLDGDERVVCPVCHPPTRDDVPTWRDGSR